MNILEFDSLFLEFGMHRVLSSVYMSCSMGQIVGLLGRNGSGKSCMLQVVFGTMQAEFKSIRFNKAALVGNYLDKKVIAYLPQIDLLPPFLSFEKAIELYESDGNKIISRT